ncbi:hypothetical protein V2J09_003695 [Rumex salicifolius]
MVWQDRPHSIYSYILSQNRATVLISLISVSLLAKRSISLLRAIAGFLLSSSEFRAMVCFPLFFCTRVGYAANEDDEEVSGIQNVKIYKYKELQAATDDFGPENKIGQGGFGSVYRGTLRNGKIAAIKVLSAESKQGVNEFLAEIKAIACIQHENLVKLYGCCVEGNQRILAWEYYDENELVLLVDYALDGMYDPEQATSVLKIALLCTQDDPKLRPSMSTVVKMLTGEVGIDKMDIHKPGLLSDLTQLRIRNESGEKKPKGVDNHTKSESDINVSSSSEYMEDSSSSVPSTAMMLSSNDKSR